HGDLFERDIRATARPGVDGEARYVLTVEGPLDQAGEHVARAELDENPGTRSEQLREAGSEHARLPDLPSQEPSVGLDVGPVLGVTDTAEHGDGRCLQGRASDGTSERLDGMLYKTGMEGRGDR